MDDNRRQQFKDSVIELLDFYSLTEILLNGEKPYTINDNSKIVFKDMITILLGHNALISTGDIKSSYKLEKIIRLCEDVSSEIVILPRCYKIGNNTFYKIILEHPSNISISLFIKCLKIFIETLIQE